MDNPAPKHFLRRVKINGVKYSNINSVRLEVNVRKINSGSLVITINLDFSQTRSKFKNKF